MVAEDYVKIASVVFAFSGWFKVYYDHQASKPKIVGRVLSVLTGTIRLKGNEQHTIFLMYPYLLNSRKNSVHILDYEACVKVKGVKGWTKLERVYGMERNKDWSFASDTNGTIKINELHESFIFTKAEPVQQGIPLHGWCPFVSKSIAASNVITDFMLVCIDANSRRHVVKTKSDGFVGPYLLAQIASIDLPEDITRKTL